MAKTITLDGLTLVDLTVTQTTTGQYAVNAIYSLSSGGQTVLSVNQDVTALLDATTLAAVAAALSAVGAAVYAAQP